MPLIVWRARRP